MTLAWRAGAAYLLARRGEPAVEADMRRYEPYFAGDTDGVHFQVCVDGTYVQAYVGRQVLARSFGLAADATDWVAVYQANRSHIDECVARRVKRDGFDTVILRLDELAASARPCSG